MIEFIKHLTGMCGEHSHPTVLTLITSGGVLGTTFVYISGVIKNLFK